jgi:Kef-type K+ transport system membrane component KefB
METLYVLLVLLVVARGLGELAVRFGQPALVGELIGGILVGVIAGAFSEQLPVLAGLTEDPVFAAITDLGVFFLMLLAGIEMHPREFAQASGSSLPVAFCAMLLPLALGFAVTWVWLPENEYRFAQALFVGTGMAITALPVAVRVFHELGQLNTRLGQLVISAAVFDIVLSLILLAALTAVIETGGLPGVSEIAALLLKVLLFFALTIAAGRYLLPWLGRRLERFVLDEFEFSLLLVIAMGAAVLAETLGMHFILGAFMAGLFFSQRAIGESVHQAVRAKVAAITTGFLAPVFFASIGLHLDLAAVTVVPVYLTVLVVIAFLGKLLCAGLPALWMGFSRREALAIGTAMSARGAVELIVAGIALRAGLFLQPKPPPPIIEYMFSAIVIVAIITTLAVPVLLRPMIGRPTEAEAAKSTSQRASAATSGK